VADAYRAGRREQVPPEFVEGHQAIERTLADILGTKVEIEPESVFEERLRAEESAARERETPATPSTAAPQEPVVPTGEMSFEEAMSVLRAAGVTHYNTWGKGIFAVYRPAGSGYERLVLRTTETGGLKAVGPGFVHAAHLPANARPIEELEQSLAPREPVGEKPEAGTAAAEPVAETEAPREDVLGMPGRAAPPPSGAKRAQGETVQIIQILKAIDDKLGVPLFTGRLLARGALGEYHRREEVIRTKFQTDLPTIAHEVGHHIEKRYGLDVSGEPELIALGAQLYPNMPRVRQAREGFAEFMRLFFTEADGGQSAAPNFYRTFNDILDRPEMHELRDALYEVRGMYQAWFAQPPWERIRGHIVGTAQMQTKRWLTWRERLYTKIYDAGFPLLKFVQEAFGAGPWQRWRRWGAYPEDLESVEENPYILYHLAAGRFGRIERFLLHEASSPDFQEFMPGLRKILEPVREYCGDPTSKDPAKNVGLFETYLVAKRAVELHAFEKETGMSDADARATVAKLEREHPEFVEAARKLYDYLDMILDHLVDSGVCDEATATILRDMYRSYVPFHRYFEQEAPVGREGTGARMANLPAAPGRMKGSTRLIINPLESIYRNTIYLLDLAERNRIGRAMIQLAGKAEGLGRLIHKVPMPVQPTEVELGRLKKVFEDAGVELPPDLLNKVVTIFTPAGRIFGKAAREGIVYVWENGQPVAYQLHPDLYACVMALDSQSAKTLSDILGRPFTQLLRAGAVLNPEFIQRNPLRDIWHAMVSFGAHPLQFIEGLAHAVRKDDVFLRFVHAGGAQSAFINMDRAYARTSLSEMLGKEGLAAKAKEVALSPIRFLEALSETLELATRLGQFARVEREALRKGLSPREAALRGAYAGRIVTVDFGRRGSSEFVREWNKLTAFFNASLQGPAQTLEQFRRNPAAFVLRGLVFVTIPSVILYLLNHDKPEYQRLDEYYKDMYWIHVADDGTIYRIPKPFEVGFIFGTVPERLLRAWYEHDPAAFREFAKNAAEVLAPSIVPTFLVPWLEALANRSFFTGIPIIPEREKRVKPSERYDVYTSTTARLLGKVFNVSPRYVEHFVRGYTGGLGMHFLRFLDWLAEQSGAVETVPRPAPRAALEQVPFVSGFVVPQHLARTGLDRFYDLLNQEEQKYATYRIKLERGERPAPEERPNMPLLSTLRRTERTLAELRKQRRRIEMSKDMTPEEKRRRLEDLDRRMEALAERVLRLAPTGR